MFSVTPDAPANVPFQSAPPRAARFDQPSGNDSFAALVDSNTADNAPAPAQDQSAPPRGSDDTPTAIDNKAPQNATATDQPAANSSDNSNAGTGQPGNADGNTDAVQQPAAKSGASKAGATKSTAKSSSSSDPAAKPAADPAALVLPSGAAVATPNAIAVAIPVAVALTDVPAASPVSGSATAPLAIAAAAIAASTVATSAVAAASAQINTSTNTDATATAAASATASDAVASATAQVQTATSKAAATPVVQPTAPTPATPATTAADVALASTVATKTPVAPKATLKASVTAPAGTTAPADPDATPVPSDPSASAGTITANLAQQLAAAGKQPTADGVADAANTSDLTGVATATIATASPHEHSPAAGVGSISTGALDASAQLANPIQPQLQSAAATATPVAALGVTAATTGAVPLSGLAMEIAVSAQSGKSRFEIRLDPADLGRIDVRIDVDSNGQVTSHLTVEKPATLSMLQQDAPQLQRALNDAGLTTGNDGLQFSLRDQSSSGQNDGGGRNAQRLVISDENTVPAAVAGQTYGRTLGSSSGVDIRV